MEIIRSASAEQLFELREQPGVRIGVVVSDNRTMVFSPVPRNVGTGSTSFLEPVRIGKRAVRWRVTKLDAWALGRPVAHREIGRR